MLFMTSIPSFFSSRGTGCQFQNNLVPSTELSMDISMVFANWQRPNGHKHFYRCKTAMRKQKPFTDRCSREIGDVLAATQLFKFVKPRNYSQYVISLTRKAWEPYLSRSAMSLRDLLFSLGETTMYERRYSEVTEFTTRPENFTWRLWIMRRLTNVIHFLMDSAYGWKIILRSTWWTTFRKH